MTPLLNWNHCYEFCTSPYQLLHGSKLLPFVLTIVTCVQVNRFQNPQQELPVLLSYCDTVLEVFGNTMRLHLAMGNCDWRHTVSSSAEIKNHLMLDYRIAWRSVLTRVHCSKSNWVRSHKGMCILSSWNYYRLGDSAGWILLSILQVNQDNYPLAFAAVCCLLFCTYVHLNTIYCNLLSFLHLQVTQMDNLLTTSWN